MKSASLIEERERDLSRICGIPFATSLVAGCETPDRARYCVDRIQALGVRVGAGTAAPSGNFTVAHHGDIIALAPVWAQIGGTRSSCVIFRSKRCRPVCVSNADLSR